MVRRIGLALLALFWGWLFYGVQDSLAFAMGPDFHAGVLLSAGWGLLFLVLVAAPLMAAAVRPLLGPTVAVIALAEAIAVALAALLSASPHHLLIAAGLAATALVPAPPRSTAAALRGLRPGAAGSLAVTAVGVVPWVAYALTCAATARGGRTVSDDTWGFDHWAVQAATPLAVVLVAALAASTLPGRRVAAWAAGGAAALLGAFFWRYPDVVASTSRPWAAAAVAWGVALVASVHLTINGIAAGLRNTG